MPGEESLRLKQYYAHPRNAFWSIMGDIFNAGPAIPYSERIQRLRLNGVAVWDVLRQCERAGSLDTRIQAETEVPNDIASLLTCHATIQRVFFNGGKAAAGFRKYIEPVLPGSVRMRVVLTRLPSTSPAHARMTLERKRDVWRNALTANGEHGWHDRP